MQKVWCYVENIDKPVADCVANGCWGGEAFLAQCLGNKPSDVLAERWARRVVEVRDANVQESPPQHGMERPQTGVDARR